MVKYKIDEKIGSGGFCTVYEAEREEDGKILAVKKLTSDDDKECVARFRREVRILKKLDHPRIINILGARLKEPPYFYIMPLYKYNLSDRLGYIYKDEKLIKAIFNGILEGVAFAHEQGIVHRDLKPENILMNNESDVVVSDFGTGRILTEEMTRYTYTGQSIGTVFFMAPELLRDAKNADIRCDIYALGQILYCMYCGSSSPVQDIETLPFGVSSIIGKCVKLDPENRFQTIDALSTAFNNIFDDVLLAKSEDIVGTYSARWLAGETLDIAELEELCLSLSSIIDETDAISDFCMNADTGLFAALYERDRALVKTIAKVFVDYITSQSWPFNYTDKIGRACRDFFLATDDPRICGLMLVGILGVGVSHNRFFVMDIFRDLVLISNNDDSIVFCDEVEERGMKNYAEQMAESINLNKVPRRMLRCLQ